MARSRWVRNAARSAANDPDQPAGLRLRSYRLAAQEIFGPAFNLTPLFALSDPAELQAATDFRDLPPAQGLTRFHHDNPLLADEWLQGAARARTALANPEQIFNLSELFSTSVDAVKPSSSPSAQATIGWRLISRPYRPIRSARRAFSTRRASSSRSSSACRPAGFDPTTSQSGLLVDEWSEVIPGPVETTGIAVHYNQPSTEPPQSLLLALTPEITGQWSWAKLEGILNDTLERAKQRAVEPDQLNGTAYGHLLPAVLSAVTSYRFGTIATDLIHATASREQ